jgi:hypothetical protein
MHLAISICQARDGKKSLKHVFAPVATGWNV